METIYKYQIHPADEISIELPLGAEVLTVQVQNGLPYIWAVVDKEEERREKRKFKVFGTGHDMTINEGRYIGTFQLDGGNLVFHLFMEK